MLELELPAISSSDVGALVEAPVVNVQVSYFNVITSQFDTVDYQLTTSRTGLVCPPVCTEFVPFVCVCCDRWRSWSGQ